MKSLIRNWLLGVVGCLALAVLSAVVAVPETVQAKGKPIKDDDGGGGSKSNYDFCVTLDNAIEDQITSDGASYCNSRKNGVMAIGGSAGFRLDTLKGSRTLTFDFRDPVNVAIPGVFNGSPVGSAGVDMRIDVQYLSDLDGNLTLIDGEPVKAGTRLDLAAMAPGTTARAALTIKLVTAQGNTWSMVFADHPGPAMTNTPPVSVTAGDTDDDGISDTWTITAKATVLEPDADQATLFQEGVGQIGLFRMPFGETLTIK